MKYFLEHNDKKYSDKDLIDAFYQLGIKRGDILLYIQNFLTLAYLCFLKMNFYRLYSIVFLKL